MYIDKKSPVPAYYQLKKHIMDKITSGQWKKEEPIPSERELSELTGVSRMTVRQAVNELVNEGVLYRLKGKGTYITKSKIEQKNIMSFSEMARNRGLEPSTDLLAFEANLVLPNIAHYLGMDANTEFYRIKRLRKAADVPIAIEEVFIPKAYCMGIEKFNLTGSLYKILLEQYHHKIERLNVSIEAVLPDEKQCNLLKTGRHTPLLKVSGISITGTGMALFYEVSCYRSDKFSYKVSVFDRKDF